MRLKHRFSLVALGIIIFAIVTPILVLYARGFTFDWATHKLIKTGAIVVKTDPNKADVYLNNKKQSGTTPLNLRFLNPADYDIRIEKVGFQPWSKRLTVKSQLVTWADFNREFVTLFLKLAQLKQTMTGSQVVLSQDRGQIAFVGLDQTLNFLDVNNDTITTRNITAGIEAPLGLSGQLIWNNGPKLYDAANFTATNNPGTWVDLQRAQNVSSDGDYTVFSLNSDLYYLTSSSNQLLDKKISGFTLAGSEVWYVQGQTLKYYNLLSNKSETINSNVPAAQTVKIFPAGSQIFAILNNSLYGLGDNFEKIADNVNFASWDDSAHLLLFGNDFEISTYDPTTKTTDLILRSTTAIKNPLLDWPTGYVFFENEGKIKAIEIDGRDRRNVYTLTDDLGNFTVSGDGRRVYTFDNNKLEEFLVR